MKKILFVSVLLCLSLLSQAQRFTSFSKDPSKTVEEMKEFYASVPKDRQKEAKAILDTFELMWTTRIDAENQAVFIDAANKMVKKKHRPIPHFQSLIHTYNTFLQSQYADESETWGKILNFHIGQSSTFFQGKMELYKHFFQDNILNQGRPPGICRGTLLRFQGHRPLGLFREGQPDCEQRQRALLP